jgi:hypothetical protein
VDDGDVTIDGIVDADPPPPQASAKTPSDIKQNNIFQRNTTTPPGPRCCRQKSLTPHYLRLYLLIGGFGIEIHTGSSITSSLLARTIS